MNEFLLKIKKILIYYAERIYVLSIFHRIVLIFIEYITMIRQYIFIYFYLTALLLHLIKSPFILAVVSITLNFVPSSFITIKMVLSVLPPVNNVHI